MRRNVMNDRRWMDGWPLVYDAVTQKIKDMKKRGRKCFSLFPFLSLSFAFSLHYQKKEAEEKSKSYPLHLKQINLISSLFFFLSRVTIQTPKKKKVDSLRRKELPLFMLSTTILSFVFFLKNSIVCRLVWINHKRYNVEL